MFKKGHVTAYDCTIKEVVEKFKKMKPVIIEGDAKYKPVIVVVGKDFENGYFDVAYESDMGHIVTNPVTGGGFNYPTKVVARTIEEAEKLINDYEITIRAVEELRSLFKNGEVILDCGKYKFKVDVTDNEFPTPYLEIEPDIPFYGEIPLVEDVEEYLECYSKAVKKLHERAFHKVREVEEKYGVEYY